MKARIALDIDKLQAMDFTKRRPGPADPEARDACAVLVKIAVAALAEDEPELLDTGLSLGMVHAAVGHPWDDSE